MKTQVSVSNIAENTEGFTTGLFLGSSLPLVGFLLLLILLG